MQGHIHTIWFTADGNLPKNAVSNLCNWSNQARNNDYQLILWTDLNTLNKQLLEKLTQNGVIVNDYTTIQHPKISWVKSLVARDDKVVYAMASCVLRIILLDISEDDQVFVYVDVNDIELPQLANDLTELGAKLKNSTWGFACGLKAALRSDLLLAYKKDKPFFTDFFTKYYNQVAEKVNKDITYLSREKANTGIWMVVNFNFLKLDDDRVSLKDTQVSLPASEVDAQNFIKSNDIFALRASWLNHLPISSLNSSIYSISARGLTSRVLTIRPVLADLYPADFTKTSKKQAGAKPAPEERVRDIRINPS